MVGPGELAQTAGEFGVSVMRIRQDHLASHLLGLLSRHLPDQIIFFGGLALARTHLSAGRLSDDLDLMVRVHGTRSEVRSQIEELFVSDRVPYAGYLHWGTRLSVARQAQAGLLTGPEGLSIRIQLLDRLGYPAWPTEVRGLEQRYRDVPDARLIVPTRAAFAAWKTASWFERHASRDLWDLWALAAIKAIDAEAVDLYVRLGPTGKPPARWLFERPTVEAQWREALAGQTRLTVSAAEAAGAVADAWEQASAGGAVVAKDD